jgi:hypothetical protein
MTKKLSPLLDTTKEGRRVYEFEAIINNRQLNLLIIDPHYEIEHKSYMSDEMIYLLAQELKRTKRFVFAGRNDK